uniref:Uncharacterized protein n=1 Tax=termite gut metagenome TaxID=433724 RepID=S0DGR4_9ZZZZ
MPIDSLRTFNGSAIYPALDSEPHPRLAVAAIAAIASVASVASVEIGIKSVTPGAWRAMPAHAYITPGLDHLPP